ncbi:MAG: MBL fold metallo-hydrolase [Chloroflexi bacterium]|nr:MBL fold metallo-hydrolase [Chloroflexota bacterium]
MVAESPDTITFLGTAGARFMVTRQLAASGGIWLNLGGTEILLDPGPGCIVQSTRRKLRADKLSAIVLSHRHLDHSNDVNVMVEAMTEGGVKKHGLFFAPPDALSSEPVLYSYLRGCLDGIELLQGGKVYSVGGVAFATPVRHVHPVETYGFVFKTGRHTFSYIADTRYFDGLLSAYHGDLLIINVVLLEDRPAVDHLTIADVKRLVSEIKPKAAILTHFGMNVWRAHPWEVAEKMTQDTGIRVMAARDGMRFDLARLDEAGEAG